LYKEHISDVQRKFGSVVVQICPNHCSDNFARGFKYITSGLKASLEAIGFEICALHTEGVGTNICQGLETRTEKHQEYSHIDTRASEGGKPKRNSDKSTPTDDQPWFPPIALDPGSR
jgi:hypothetical protein